MKIILVSAFPITRYNLGYPCAFIYQLLKYAPKDMDIHLYYFSGDAKYKEMIKRDLDSLLLKEATQINYSPPKYLKQKFLNWHSKIRRLPIGVRRFPKIPKIVKQINNSSCDLVWFYPSWLVDWIPVIQCKRILITGPDSAALHSERVIRFGKWDSFKDILPEFYQLQKNTNLERIIASTNAKVHFVGKEDLMKYISLTHEHEKCFFVPHPHYDYIPIKGSLLNTQEKLRVVFSGGGETVYVGDHLLRIISLLTSSNVSRVLSSSYEFLFIGQSYEESVLKLRNAGFDVIQKKWVENYEDELSKAHIQIFPIAVGTGTKGKVLSALSTGLLSIGSEFAFENIEVIPGEDFLLYNKIGEVIEYLIDILKRRAFFDEVAKRGAIKVRKNHAPELVCNMFWGKVKEC